MMIHVIMIMILHGNYKDCDQRERKIERYAATEHVEWCRATEAAGRMDC